MKLKSTHKTPLRWRACPDNSGGLGEAPNTPVQKGIEKFVAWYKTYFEPETLNSKL
jgi:hypothetical protein